MNSFGCRQKSACGLVSVFCDPEGMLVHVLSYDSDLTNLFTSPFNIMTLLMSYTCTLEELKRLCL